MKLIPQHKGQKLNLAIWEQYTPAEMKFELAAGEAFWGGEERDKLLLMLIYNAGLEKVVELLPDESKETLHQLLKKK